MAREISHTLLIEGQLVAAAPLHLGGADNAHESDMPLAVDGMGRFYLPGSSLAGAIRAWERAQDGDVIWGYARGDQGQASYMLVDDAPACDKPLPELWHGIGIDRRHGGAARRVKFDRQVLPQGTTFQFHLVRELAVGQDLGAARAQMGRILLALENGDISFGAASTRGYGRVRLQQARVGETAWNSQAGILAWLAGNAENARQAWEEEARKTTHSADCLLIELHWRALGPLMSRAARDGLAVDILPFISRTGAGQALALPGSGIKGALRSHAERIIRTVLADDLHADAEHHFDQLAVELAGELFGTPRPAADSLEQGARATGARGLLSVDTCYSRRMLSAAELATFDQVPQTVPDGGPFVRADHVAIDRWTGAAADGVLYSAIEPRANVWQPIRLRLRRADLGTTAALALLWLTVRDFCTGRLTLGFGANRGYGDLEVTRVELANWPQSGERAVLGVSNGVIDETDIAPLVKEMKSAWTEWLQAKEMKA
jgi:CRISPR/Cas system CSM-associated protein Csm3 (group 7 of RAMP superfamily)